jgi:hypothetical protein
VLDVRVILRAILLRLFSICSRCLIDLKGKLNIYYLTFLDYLKYKGVKYKSLGLVVWVKHYIFNIVSHESMEK